MDSSGIIRMLNRKFGLSWIPVANTKDHVSLPIFTMAGSIF
jgi:hypothetical protein